jgi:hypothetical protein
MVFNATFNNISAISWLSVLFVEETGGPGENHRGILCYNNNNNNFFIVPIKGPEEAENYI